MDCARARAFSSARFEEVHRERWNQGSRQEVRREHGEDHGFGERLKQIVRHAPQSEHGKKDDADAKRGNQRGYRDLRRAFENSLVQRLALLQVPRNIFNGHRRVVHQDADGQSQAAQRHQVDGFMQKAEDNHRAQDGQRNRNADDHGAAPASQEHQDHQRGEDGGDAGFPDHTADGGANENGLIRQRLNLELRRQRLLRRGEAGRECLGPR